MSTVLVTGANGFVGSGVLSKLVQAGHTVIGVTRNIDQIEQRSSNVSWRFADFSDVSTITSICEGIDVVIHLAARKNDEKDSYMVNVLATNALLLEAKKSNVQLFIFCSTQSVKLPMRGVYAQTKLEAEQSVMNFTDSFRTVIYRPSILYDHSSKGIVGTIAQMIQGPFVPIFGDGSVTFRPMHINDFADLLVQTIVLPPKNTPYDIGGLTEISFIDLVQSIARVFHKKPRLIHIPKRISIFLANVISFIPKFPITKSNILGAIQLVSMDIQPVSSTVNFHNRIFDPTLFLDKKNYFLEQEGKMLLQYFNKHISFEKHPELLLHYVNASKKHRVDSIYLPKMPRIYLYCFDAVTALFVKNCMLRKKLLIATAVFETNPVSAHIVELRNKSLISIILPLVYYSVSIAIFMILGIPLLLFPSYYHGRTL